MTDHAVTLEALHRTAERRARSLFPEGPCIPQAAANDTAALIRACLGILKAHRDELDALKEQLAEIHGKTVA